MGMNLLNAMFAPRHRRALTYTITWADGSTQKVRKVAQGYEWRDGTCAAVSSHLDNLRETVRRRGGTITRDAAA
jgi:hypothetical protein